LRWRASSADFWKLPLWPAGFFFEMSIWIIQF
jgi:hypothetical protein